ncbi:MAG: type II toxin-antitoxin system HicB family antitoxin [Candidatus Cloacimonetes bacterium]|nr:type II toxin-antitoxin system HicB family antitoxin [Candidatus Cloacimonadota bacterium]
MKKNVEYYKDLPYTIEITPDDGVFFVKIKELPGCISQGDTIQEALEMIDDAMNCWLEAALEDVDTIPLPESMQECNYSGKISLRMPKSLHKRLTINAKIEGVSLNSYIVTALAENNSYTTVKNMLSEKGFNKFFLSSPGISFSNKTNDWFADPMRKTNNLLKKDSDLNIQPWVFPSNQIS